MDKPLLVRPIAPPKIVEPCRTIILTNGMSAIIDAFWYPALSQFAWHAVKRRRCYYAYATVAFREYSGRISMSRLTAATPPDQVCHHRNRNSLDNQTKNLLNMYRHEHELLHRNNSLLIKYATPPG